VGVAGTLAIAGDVYAAGILDVTGDIGSAGSVTVGGGLVGNLMVGGNLAGSVQVSGNHTGTIDIQGNLGADGSVSVGGRLTGSAKITVFDEDAGTITVNKGTEGGTKIQARGGLSDGSSINVNATGVSTETVAGTIWIGGSVTQNPMPVLTMDGVVRINCMGGTYATGAKVKLVGCPPFEDAPATVCVNGTAGPIIQTPVCLELFSAQCPPEIALCP
jgi:hypothetical protein